MTPASPAERYAAARARQHAPVAVEFRDRQPFRLDDFQESACQWLEAGHNVLVAAPTGSGKTLVAEFAVHLALRHLNTKVFYTTPIKALSNQKYHDFARQYGYDRVGLLTGDTAIRPDAPIVIMTTEVLRNMLYAQSELLLGLGFVVLDEVHYLADRFRGAVWEEVILHLPDSVRLVCLSATVSNVREFGDWLDAVRGHTEIALSDHRPVPLSQHALVRTKLVDLFDAAVGDDGPKQVNPDVVRLVRSHAARTAPMRHRGRRRKPPGRPRAHSAFKVWRSDVISTLAADDLLPAIVFIFSRVGCDQAVRQLVRSGVRLTTHEQRVEIRDVVDARCAEIPAEDLGVLGYSEWVEGLERGVASHHAGLIPAFKEVVEELFERKLVTVVFATETLALGVNMPARTVVIEKLEKFNGETRAPITPAEYTQLTGRAGRRGIDRLGHAVVQWYDGLNPQAVASLASRRTYPLNSSFRPTYNMSANLLEQFGPDRTRTILESSFAQFQADRAVVDMARSVRKKENSLSGYAEAMTCHLGDFAEYAALRRELSDREKQGSRRHPLSEAQRVARKRDLSRLRAELRAHPCHDCADREKHARWAERWWRLNREISTAKRRIRSRTGAVAAVFDRITTVLLELDYVEFEGDRAALTAPGRRLRRIYGERDLLVTECLSRSLWNDLDAPGLAAVACALVFEPRRDTPNVDARFLPRGSFREALGRTEDVWARLDDLERSAGLNGSEPLATGLVPAMHAWARGVALGRVLVDANLAAGDFVRWCKQTLDLLDQLATVAPAPVADTARKAGDTVRRGIVAYSSVI